VASGFKSSRGAAGFSGAFGVSGVACRIRRVIANRPFSTSPTRRDDEFEEKAKKLDQKGLDEHEQEVRVRQHQVKRPWHREDADKPPVREPGDEKTPLTKGKTMIAVMQMFALLTPSSQESS
jgi:hypothetical protein